MEMMDELLHLYEEMRDIPDRAFSESLPKMKVLPGVS